MIDIFEEGEQPKLYIADILVEVLIPTRSKKKKEFDRFQFSLEKNPIVLINGEIPTEKSKNNFFYGIYSQYIRRSDFNKMIFKIKSITNIKFSSNLAYKFDYLIH